MLHAPHGLDIIETCLSCPYREEGIFCNLPQAAVADLERITAASLYPKGSRLFLEGQRGRGVYILCSGRVKLSTSSREGRTLIVRMAESGEILGLPSTVTGSNYELTAEVVEATQANFIAREEFLAFLQTHGEAAVRVAQQLGKAYQAAVAEMRSVGLSHSAAQKMAQFILNWYATNTLKAVQSQSDERAILTLTHEEIGQMIGATRETVTRIFSKFKRKHLLTVKGSEVVLLNRTALEVLASGI